MKKFNLGELNHLKKLNKRLGVNSWRGLTQEERLELIIESKTFTCLATIGTLGIYYLYYLFCLEQRAESPFNKEKEVCDGRKILKYEWEKPIEEDEKFLEISKINRNLCNLFECKRNIDKVTQFKNKFDETIHKKSITFVLVINQIGSIIETIVSKLTGKHISLDLIQKDKKRRLKLFVEREEEIRRYINEKLRSKLERRGEEIDPKKSFENYLYNKPKSQSDNFLSFFYIMSYGMASLITLGLFPIYHLVIKERWNDFWVIKNHKEHANTHEFNCQIERLINSEGNLDYSYLLLANRKVPFSISSLSKTYKTKVFRNLHIRKKIVTLIMVLSLGLFGIWIMTDNAFHRNEKRLEIEEYEQETDYRSMNQKIEKFVKFLKDLFRDIKVAMLFASNREKQINSSMKTLFGSDRDKITSTFKNTLSSPLYYWAFTLSCWLSCLTGIIVAICTLPISSLLFWLPIMATIIFGFLITRHVQMLFV